MNNLQTLKLSDNFDVWRDLINKSIVAVNSLVTVPLSSSNQIGFVLSNSYNPNTSETTIFWKDMNVILKELGINTGGSGGTDTEVEGTHFPTGLTVGLDDTNTSYVKLLQTGNIDASNNITCLHLTARGSITTQENISATGNINGNIISSLLFKSNGINLRRKVNKEEDIKDIDAYINFFYDTDVSTPTHPTSNITEINSGVLSINDNIFSKTGSTINSDLILHPIENNSNAIKNDIILRNDDTKFYIRTINENLSSPFIMDISTGEITINHGIVTSKLHCRDKVIFDKELTVSDDGKSIIITNDSINILDNTQQDPCITLNGVKSVMNGDLDINGTLSVDKLNADIVELNVNSLKIEPNIHSGAGSSFASDLYINSKDVNKDDDNKIGKSLIIRNYISENNIHYAHFMVSDEINGSPNELRPISFNMNTGEVFMENGVCVKGTLKTSNSNAVIDGSLKVKTDIDAGGNIKGYRVYNAVFNDYAEFFERGEETEVGDIISLDMSSDEERYVKATNPRLVVGVHSNTYGHILGGDVSIEESEKTHIPVGLSGRVKTKIVGSIEKGDEVILSDIPGVGRKFNPDTDRERDIIGFAVETNLSEDIKLVKIKI